MQARDCYWPVRPRPLPDESFSSWFRRVAEGNGLPPKDLYRAALPGSYLHGKDLDRLACPDLLAELAGRCGLDAARLRDLTFQRWCGSVYDEDDGRRKLHWLPPAGRDGSRVCFGQQFCPQCLAEDEVPYFRSEWRLAFVTLCARHAVTLCDRCPGCRHPVQPLQLKGLGRQFLCPKCNTPLTRAAGAPALQLDIAMQEQFLAVARDGWAELRPWGPLHALSFFHLVTILFRLLAAGPFARPLRNRLAESDQERWETAQIPVAKDVELLPPERRLQMLRLVARMLGCWPHRFVDACRDLGISQRHLIKAPAQTPFAFWSPVSSALSAPVRSVGTPELQAGIDILRKRGRKPTYAALQSLFDVKLQAGRQFAEAADDRDPYGSGRYWKLDGVSPEVRRAVLFAAHRDGENVAGWVERALRQALAENGCPGLEHGRPQPRSCEHAEM